MSTAKLRESYISEIDYDSYYIWHLIYIDREYSLNGESSNLICAEKCGKRNECPNSTICDYESDVCIADGEGA